MRKEDTESLVPYRNCVRVNYAAEKKMMNYFVYFLIFLYLCTVFINSTQVK